MSPCSLRRGCLAAGVAAALVIPLSCAWANKAYLGTPYVSCQIKFCSPSLTTSQDTLVVSRAWRTALRENALRSRHAGGVFEYEPPRPPKAPTQAGRRCVGAVSAIGLTPLCTASTATRWRVGVTHSLTGEMLATTDVSGVEKTTRTHPRRQRLASGVSRATVSPVRDDASDPQVVEAVLGDSVKPEDEAARMLNKDQRTLIRQLRTTVYHL